MILLDDPPPGAAFCRHFGVWVMSQITAWRPGGVSRHLGRQLGRLHAVIYGLLLNGQLPPSDSKNTSIFTARTGFRTRALPR